MDVSIENIISSASGETESGQARYEIIADALRRSISNGRAPQGLVLLEAPLARIFGTSRVPVRQALSMLCEQGHLHRFPGRGYLVGSEGEAIEPVRLSVNACMFAEDAVAEVKNLKPLGDRLYDTLLAEISAFLVFGRYRIDERMVMETMSVGRNLVRECLSRLADQQLIIKEPYGQWQTVALTARALVDEFELRLALQPGIIHARTPSYDHVELAQLQAAVLSAQQSSAIDQIEQVLAGINHLLFRDLSNRKAQWVLAQCQSAALLDRYLRRALPSLDDQAMLNELMQALDFLRMQDATQAAAAYREHLHNSEQRAFERLKVLAVLPEPSPPGYLIKT